MSQVTFTNIQNERIKALFHATHSAYDFPEDARVNLVRTRIKGSTMQAQPVIKVHNLYEGIDTYRIRLAKYVRDSRELRVDDLHDDVLVGWFAHELGHVIDYMQCSALGMISYGLKYLFSARFRREAEHRADEIAMKQGFQDQILQTKEFLFNHDLIDEKYRKKMKKYYMSIEDARAFIKREVPIDPIN